jgi:hypothetical protein
MPYVTCPSCDARTAKPFYELPAIPTNSCLLIDRREDALEFPVAPLQLSWCEGCGFIFNAAWEPARTIYSQAYEETQGFSATFNAFQERLARDLVSRHGLRGKDIVEIGCGKGEFLSLLCRLGGNKGVGYDPSFVPSRLDPAIAGQVRFVREFFDERSRAAPCDFLCCKMTFEHIPDVRGFLAAIRHALQGQDGTTVFFQVPDASRILREGAFWDIYYEHCSYFTACSLSNLFERSGFAVDRVWTDYDDQYLMVEARPADARLDATPAQNGAAATGRQVATFARKAGSEITAWRDRLKDTAGAGGRTALWGSGSKAVAFLTTLGLDGEIDYVVDINPFRQGRFMPATGHRIASPDDLPATPPDLVVVMNPVYRDEVREALRKRGCAPEILTV